MHRHAVVPQWRNSSYGGSGNGQCVEVACPAVGLLVRDSRATADGTLRFAPERWSSLDRRLR
ncbi:DUF397 domain-containing protein [Streptodolium elevatio]|uniref:DUF397 domain-containing protein n=1 Tax=Streptodolium elevatio TaxID=3157996 RepID=A0ABV3DHW5_9ACTN